MFAWLSRSESRIVAAILLLFVCVGVSFSLVPPPFEKPDELYHYAFARHLAQGNGLPVQTLDNLGPWEHEGTQAPLYYFLLGRLTAGIDQRDFDQLNQQNPHANLGDPLYPGNKNMMLYSSRPLPLAGANLALHVGRWFSLTLACVSLLFVYATARLAFPRSAPARLLALLFVATIPQFAFISSSTSNDNLVILLSLATVFWLARLVSRAATEPIRPWEWLIVGVLLGLAALSKLHGLVLLAPIALVVAWLAWERRSPRLVLTAVPAILLPAIAIAGWWYWRNMTLYGDWLGAERLLSINGMRSQPLTRQTFVGEMRGLRYSFWGLFGWFSILLPDWIYRVLDALSILAVLGFAARGITRWTAQKGKLLTEPHVRVQALLAFWAVTLVASMIYWATFATSSQGRLLFPALSAFAVILVVGLRSILQVVRVRQWRVLTVLPLALLACSAYTLLYLLPSIYRAPQPIANLPAAAQETHIVYNNEVELVGVALPEGRFKPGDEVPITLYLRAQDRRREDLPLFVQLLDEKRETIGNVTTHPGWGRFPTSMWEPGALYADSYRVRVEQPISNRSPLLAQVYVGFVESGSEEPLLSIGPDGKESSGIVGHVALESAEKLDVAALGLQPAAATFEQGVQIAGVRYEAQASGKAESLPVTILYRASGQPAGDYVAFLHLTDSTGRQVAGQDHPPAQDRFPTHAWRSGDQILSDFELPMPQGGLAPGIYYLWTGLYPAGTDGEPRLGVVSSDQPMEHMSVQLGSIEVR